MLVLLGLAACADRAAEPVWPEDLVVFLGPVPETLDPALAEEGQALVVALATLDGLLTPHPATLAPRPGAAGLPTVEPDGRTVRFRLLPGRTWADGTPLTAGDFVRGWRRSLSVRRQGPLPPGLAQVAGAQEVWLGGLVVSDLPPGLDARALESALLPYGAVASLEMRGGGREALILPSREAIRLENLPGRPTREAICGWVERTLPADLAGARCSLAHAPSEWRALVRLGAVGKAGDLDRARRALAAARYRGRALTVRIPSAEEVIAEAVTALDGSRLVLTGEPVDLARLPGPIRVRRTGPEDLGVEAVDDRTLDVTLRAPAEEWLAQLAVSPELLPWPAEALDPEAVLRRGSGPYRLAERLDDGTVVLESRRPDREALARVVLLPGPGFSWKGEDPRLVARGSPWPGRPGAVVTGTEPAMSLADNERGLPVLGAEVPVSANAE